MLEEFITNRTNYSFSRGVEDIFAQQQESKKLNSNALLHSKSLPVLAGLMLAS